MRRSDTLLKAVSVILLIAIICYMGFHVADSLLNPLQTVLAVNASTLESASCEGYVIRNEKTLSAEGMISPVEDGKKVSAGGVIAVNYTSTEALERADEILNLEERISRLKKLLSSGGQEDAFSSLVSLSLAVNRRELSNLDNLLYNSEYAIFGAGSSTDDPTAELELLSEQLSSLKSQQYGYTYITASSSGIFTSAVDGFERITPDMLTDLTPASLENMFSSPAKTDSFGKLVSGLRWYFAAVMSAEDASRLTEGGTAKLTFTKNYSATLDMKIEEIGQSTGDKCVVVFSTDSDMTGICSVREVSAEIVFDSYTGILVPNSAIYYDEDGSTYVYLLVGLQSERVDIDIICDYNEYYIIAKAAEGHILNEGAEIITVSKNLFDGKVVK